VKPEPHYCLFVRFKDGAAGRVRLRPEQLTGVLAPLRDEQFFERADRKPAARFQTTHLPRTFLDNDAARARLPAR
jgi:hypothetical protein